VKSGVIEIRESTAMRILDTLRLSPQSIAEICDETGLSRRSVIAYLQFLLGSGRVREIRLDFGGGHQGLGQRKAHLYSNRTQHDAHNLYCLPSTDPIIWLVIHEFFKPIPRRRHANALRRRMKESMNR
jgi:hypothetical protein